MRFIILISSFFLIIAEAKAQESSHARDYERYQSILTQMNAKSDPGYAGEIMHSCTSNTHLAVQTAQGIRDVLERQKAIFAEGEGPAPTFTLEGLCSTALNELSSASYKDAPFSAALIMTFKYGNPDFVKMTDHEIIKVAEDAKLNIDQRLATETAADDYDSPVHGSRPLMYKHTDGKEYQLDDETLVYLGAILNADRVQGTYRRRGEETTEKVLRAAIDGRADEMPRLDAQFARLLNEEEIPYKDAFRIGATSALQGVLERLSANNASSP
ncbi:MAG: hypothetical protein ACSHXY_00550 [Alphaproteobacteria bacterium]